MKNIKSIVSSAVLAIALSTGCSTPMSVYKGDVAVKAQQTQPRYLELIIKEKRQDSDVCLSLEGNRILRGNHNSEIAVQKSSADKPYTLRMYDARGKCLYQCKVPSHLEIKFEGHLPVGWLSEARTKVLVPYDGRINRVMIKNRGKYTALLTLEQLNK
ncbi:MAG: hypothetical protein AABX07_03795 [Nanoarchaeota archaeon]